MGKKNDSTIVAGAGFIADLITKLRADVIDLGGSDGNLFALNKGEGRAMIRKMAELVVGAKSEAKSLMTLAQMIADAGFPPDRFDAEINELNFPLGKEGAYDASGLSLFGDDREWTIAEVEAAVKSNGGRLEGLVRGLAYLKANPDALKDGPIVFPASSWVSPGGSVRAPRADLYGGEPWLDLDWDGRGVRWYRRCRFLVSGKSSA